MSNTLNRKSLLKISFTTNVFEIYDIGISGYLAAIIGHLFFKNSEVMVVILSFAMFAATFLIQPIGGLFWGYIGDKYGSGRATKYSMLIMGLPTCVIGLLPTYTSLGSVATVILLGLKLVQGFGAGGQVPTNISYVYEQSLNTKDSPWYCGMVACGGWVGSFLSAMISLLLYSFIDEKVIHGFAWRLPFLLSIPMFLMMIRFRRDIETLSANVIKHKNPYSFDKNFFSAVTKCFILLAFMQISFYMLFVWMPTYLETFLHVAHSLSRSTNVIVLIVAIISVGLWSYLGKFINYKKVILTSTLLLVLLSYPLFCLLQHASFWGLLFIQLLFVIIYTPIEGSYVVAIGKMFSSNNRNLGIGLTWNTAIALFGGTMPVVCSYFIHLLNFNMFPVFYLITFGIIALPAVWLMK